MSRPRVLQVVGSLGVGGAEKMIVAATPQLLEHGYDVDFLVFGERRGELERDVREMGCRILRMAPPHLWRAPQFLGQLRELMVREGPYRGVHSHVNLASGVVCMAAARAGVPVRIAHSHHASDQDEGVLRVAYRVASRHLLRTYASQFAACGAEAGAYLFGEVWEHSGVIIPNGVDVSHFRYDEHAREQVRHEWGVGSGVPVAGSIARLVPFKNHDFMLSVVAEDARVGGSMHLVVAGEGPMRAELGARVEALGLQDRIHFLGLRSDVAAIMSGLDVILMPSWHEGLPVTLVEAQAAGTPAIVSEAVTQEADLGLGILERLPTDSAAHWRDAAIRRAARGRPTQDQVEATFRECGYDVASSARRLISLYEDVE